LKATARLREEFALNGRYAASGVLNSIIGLGTISVLTIAGAPPIVANVLGYGLSLTVAFLSARRFVFRSEGRFSAEALRYLISFAICYSLNVVALYVALAHFRLRPLISQGIAVLTYVVAMYLLSRVFVFAPKTNVGS
jgi:putative flippase GtrA